MRLRFIPVFIILLILSSSAYGFIAQSCNFGPELNCIGFFSEYDGPYVSFMIMLKPSQEFDNLRFEIPNCDTSDERVDGNQVNITLKCVPEKSDYYYIPPTEMEDSDRFSYRMEFNIFDGDKLIARGRIFDPFIAPPKNFKPSLIFNGYLKYYGWVILFFPGVFLVILLVKQRKKK